MTVARNSNQNIRLFLLEWMQKSRNEGNNMDEKMRILTMVEEGKLSAKEAIDLIDALEKTTPEEEFMSYSEDFDSQAFTKQSTTSYENKMLKIIVDTPDGDKVNVQLPVKIIRQVLKMTGKLPIKNEDLQGIDLDALTTTILECLDNETLGNIVEVDSADGTIVKVFIK